MVQSDPELVPDDDIDKNLPDITCPFRVIQTDNFLPFSAIYICNKLEISI